MNINKKTEIIIKDDLDNIINVGTFCVLTTKDGKALCGNFTGISKRGSMTFALETFGIEFGVMPKNIVNIVVANLDKIGRV